MRADIEDDIREFLASSAAELEKEENIQMLYECLDHIAETVFYNIKS